MSYFLHVNSVRHHCFASFIIYLLRYYLAWKYLYLKSTKSTNTRSCVPALLPTTKQWVPSLLPTRKKWICLSLSLQFSFSHLRHVFKGGRIVIRSQHSYVSSSFFHSYSSSNVESQSSTMVNMRTLVYLIVLLALMATSCYARSVQQDALRDILSLAKRNSPRVKRLIRSFSTKRFLPETRWSTSSQWPK